MMGRSRLSLAAAAMALASSAGAATAETVASPTARQRRYYDPGSNPRPQTTRVRTQPLVPKTPSTPADHSRLAAAEAKRLRKRAARAQQQPEGRAHG